MAKAATKSEVIKSIIKTTGLSRKQTVSVLDALTAQIKKELPRRGIFVLAGLVKIMVVKKPAVPQRTGINPFTKLEQVFKAKPARKVVKVRALKRLKDSVK